jgi:DNA repair protein RadC
MPIPQLTVTSKRGKLVAGFSHHLPASERPKIVNSYKAYECLLPLFDGIVEYRERFAILLLNQSNKAICTAVLSEGGVAGTVVDPKIIFQHALLANASAMTLCHNHPSGSMALSAADTEITQKVKAAGKVLDIIVYDHIIITSEGYYSFADEGIF